MKKIIVIGGGFSGLTAASMLAKDGNEVTLIEKNEQTGGRAREWESNGFKFDMGPSWYWMPEVFENFYQLFGKKSSDFYQLVRLDPGYRVFFTNNDNFDVPANLNELKNKFEQREKGSGEKLIKFLKDAEFKYNTAMQDYVTRISDSITEFFELKLLIKTYQLKLFTSIRKQIRSQFKDPLLISVLEFPVLFLGSTPSNTPSLYSMMNYADLVLGTWFPLGGMVQISKAFTSIAEMNGVNIKLNEEVISIISKGNLIEKVITNKSEYDADVVVGSADYHHIEQVLLKSEDRVYSEKYWESRSMSPSSLLFYVGINTKLKNILHHNLFFDEDFETHANEIYKEPKWPSKPLFYLCASSITDKNCAPENHENLFFLIPLAPGLKDNEELREKYFQIMCKRLEIKTGIDINKHIVVKRSYAMNDFIKDYNSFKGNAYGLANTLRQTAFLKPKIKSKKLKNLFYTGQLTVPGPGVPPAIISGKIVAKEINKLIFNKQL